MDYTRNEDHWCDDERPYHRGVSYNQMLGRVQKGAITTYPVTLAEVKNFCKIDIAEDDVLIEDIIIPAALDMCEDISNISFVQREMTVALNNLNGNTYLPLGPVSGTPTAVDREGTAIAEITVTPDEWKKVIEPRYSYLQVTYTGGYDDLPMKLKTALLNAIYYLYDNRNVSMDDIGPMAKAILKPISRV